jgi:hypothetical protein
MSMVAERESGVEMIVLVWDVNMYRFWLPNAIEWRQFRDSGRIYEQQVEW